MSTSAKPFAFLYATLLLLLLVGAASPIPGAGSQGPNAWTPLPTGPYHQDSMHGYPFSPEYMWQAMEQGMEHMQMMGAKMHQQRQPWTSSDTAVSATHVEIENFRFHPASIKIEAGTAVVWVNEDQVAHTVTEAGGAWTSPLLQTGETWSYTFQTPGVYQYYCAPHPYMTGTITVQ